MPLRGTEPPTMNSPELQRQEEQNHLVTTGVMTSGVYSFHPLDPGQLILPLGHSSIIGLRFNDLHSMDSTPLFHNVSLKPILHLLLEGHSHTL